MNLGVNNLAVKCPVKKYKANKKQEAYRKAKLGMTKAKARRILLKKVFYDWVCLVISPYCYRCKEFVEYTDDWHIDHKTSWIRSSNPLAAFLDLGNIAISHAECNLAKEAKEG